MTDSNQPKFENVSNDDLARMIHEGFAEVQSEIKAGDETLQAEIRGVEGGLRTEIRGAEERLGARIQGNANRIDALAEQVRLREDILERLSALEGKVGV